MVLNVRMMQKKTAHSALKGRDLDENQNLAAFYNEKLQALGKKRDKSSFIEIFEYFAPRVKAYLIKSGSDEAQADELAQETMLTVWNKAEHFNPALANASTWIFTIARNKRVDLYRRHKDAELDLDLDRLEFALEDDKPSPYENFGHMEESEVLQDAVQQLPQEQYEVIKKFFFEDKSHSTISKETGMALGTVKSRIRLALNWLRRRKKVQDL